MKRCAQCHGKLGLGVRSRNFWNGRWWAHTRFCSAPCEGKYELERYNAKSHGPFQKPFIPNPIDQNPWAHWRSPMDMMRQG